MWMQAGVITKELTKGSVMNTSKLRSKRVLIPTITAATVLAVAGPVWAVSTSDDLRGSERDRVAAAAAEAVGGGTAVEVETSDDRGEAYEVEVRTDGGTEIEVALDKDLEVVSKDTDEQEDGDGQDDRDDAPETKERALSATERESAEKAALKAVGGGTVLEVEAGDDSGEAYEVEVRDADGVEWDVNLDADYTVLDKTIDD